MENKYIVKVPNIFSNSIEIEAENEEDAKKKVKALLTESGKENNYPLTYEVTLAEDYWGVFSEEDIEKIKKENENK